MTSLILVNPPIAGGTMPGRAWSFPLEDATRLKKMSQDLRRDRLNGVGWHGWEVVGLTLHRGDLVAWPVVLLKRRKPRP
jgi:hypothetical protein